MFHIIIDYKKYHLASERKITHSNVTLIMEKDFLKDKKTRIEDAKVNNLPLEKLNPDLLEWNKIKDNQNFNCMCLFV